MFHDVMKLEISNNALKSFCDSMNLLNEIIPQLSTDFWSATSVPEQFSMDR